MKPFSITASAGATVANQPSFDLGGFPIRVQALVAGKEENWENLRDSVTIGVGQALSDEELKAVSDLSQLVEIENLVEEADTPELPVCLERNTAGRLLRAAILFLESNDVVWRWPLSVRVEKGISVKGTGLGSSGATPAAALKAFEEVMEKLGVAYKFGRRTKAQLLLNADCDVPDNAIPAFFGDLVKIGNGGESGGEKFVEQIKPGENFGAFVVVTPKGFGIKTADARKALAGKSQHESHDQEVENMIAAIEAGDAAEYGKLMEAAHSWFVGPRSRLYPGDGRVFDQVVAAAKKAGACGVTISGAGPTMLAVAKNQDDAWQIGEAMHQAFAEAGFDSVARVVEIDKEGAKIED